MALVCPSLCTAASTATFVALHAPRCCRPLLPMAPFPGKAVGEGLLADVGGQAHRRFHVGGKGALGQSWDTAKILRIDYMSKMNGEEDAALHAVQQIVARARDVNQRNHVTGILSYDSRLRQVWQILEGRPEDVLPLWGQIQRDDRHVIHQNCILIEGDEQRHFPRGWGMHLRLRGADLV
eukprot:CAMPEP_0177489252 /NCGR_PEP_ID=MMETSP0369-20130122/30591_1 /TAXON_ID=447022 ORGANISM="Scrippsiella hangoei-like, Strain SHHI-4" /NCGR_SAMPLE_ID=MMETSP0369 /ASSEMBLY_ACC=CAM_ASM_000364 /LENGTH=179 /DNA_ID=CAMNT_0018965677 /DNA_START=87 /DNA_END=626 /DNA_ORIENTATION=+